jgi:hypothetical protein
MSLKGAVLTLVALGVGSLLLFADTGPGALLGLSLITLAASAVVTTLVYQDRDDDIEPSKSVR